MVCAARFRCPTTRRTFQERRGGHQPDQQAAQPFATIQRMATGTTQTGGDAANTSRRTFSLQATYGRSQGQTRHRKRSSGKRPHPAIRRGTDQRKSEDEGRLEKAKKTTCRSTGGTRGHLEKYAGRSRCPQARATTTVRSLATMALLPFCSTQCQGRKTAPARHLCPYADTHSPIRSR